MTDEIRPGYYKGLGGLEPIHLIHALGLNADAAGVIKYVCRHGRKPGTNAIEDLKKAKTYLEFMIAEAEGHPVIMPAGWMDVTKGFMAVGDTVLRGTPGPGQDPLSGNEQTITEWHDHTCAPLPPKYKPNDPEPLPISQPTDRAIANSPPFACPDLDEDFSLDRNRSEQELREPVRCVPRPQPVMPQPSVSCDCVTACDGPDDGEYCIQALEDHS